MSTAAPTAAGRDRDLARTASAPTTALANQELFAARGGINQCRRALRDALRNVNADRATPATIDLHTAIDALSVAVEALARIVEGQR